MSNIPIIKLNEMYTSKVITLACIAGQNYTRVIGHRSISPIRILSKNSIIGDFLKCNTNAKVAANT